MTDELDDLKAAFDAATPAPDPLKKRENIAMAEKNFADLQGLASEARPTPQNGPIGGLLNGVRTMLNTLTTRAGLTATTALVAVGVLAILPNTPAFQAPTGGTDLTQTELGTTAGSGQQANRQEHGRSGWRWGWRNPAGH